MGNRRIAALLTFALAAGLVVTGAGTASAGPASDESAFVSKINAERSRRGLRTLVVRSDLVRVARRHSSRMAASGTIYHNSNLANEVGGNWRELGENVGVGPDVNVLHSAFMSSTSHRANILKRSYNEIGVGVVYGSDGNIYVTEVFAARGTTTTVKKTTTTTVKKTTTVRRTTTRKAAPRPAARAVAAAAQPKPAAVPEAPPQTRTVDLLVRLIGLDAEAVDPETGLVEGL